ncbi:MAG: alanine--tRNA ligase [Bacteroidia bacterium]
MTSAEIRKQFLDFFESKGHTIVQSAPIVVKNDPTLMFTNAGMNQFKDWFLGNETPKYKRVVDTQKCLRVSGKHNDLEEVGVDTYHHTMFEMLGNWSFGDYFKKEAIEWAWELLVDVYKLPKDRLYVTVFEGDAKEGLAFDQEAFDNWKLYIAEDRILNGNKKDNFWEMGDTGPCGPCSEIHIDLRPDTERIEVDGKTLVNNDHPQVIEIWNNVFMEFNRKADGSLENLPAQHVDTGMGFERLVRAIEGKTSNYDTDVFVPTIQFIENFSKVKYQFSDSKQDIAMRVMADHIRAISFAIADGQLPSNNGAGYVIRRILRRAVRYQYQFLGIKEPFMCQLALIIAESFKTVFPELHAQKDFVSKVIREEELSFLRTLENGLLRLENYFLKNVSKHSGMTIHTSDEPVVLKSILKGDFAFELSDTFGFPLDLTQLIARENGFTVDEIGFQKALDEQKIRSRKATELTTDDWVETLHATSSQQMQTTFLGYDQTEAEIQISKYRKVKAKGKESYQLVFNQTPFYPEGGGQIGDTGFIGNINEKVEIIDTKKENNLIIHFTDSLPENIEASFTATVDKNKRKLTENNHSATHLLHAALRQVLGTHVAQKGSLVNNENLRFDFSHFSAMTKEEIAKVEQIVNQKIRENISLDERRSVPIEEAKTLGAMMLFGEKYGDSVRVITFDDQYSRELCGGTHVKATGQIGLFKIVSEAAVAAGVRRIEAITSDAAQTLVDSWQLSVESLEKTFSSKDILKSVNQLINEKADLLKKLEVFENEKTIAIKTNIKSEIRNSNGVNVLVQLINISNAEQLKNLSFQLKTEVENLFCVLGCVLNEKPMLSVIISDNLVKEKGLHAGNIIKELAKEIKGGGGGQSFYATAGGNDVNGLQAAIEKAKLLI